jgi:hypothetical protein
MRLRPTTTAAFFTILLTAGCSIPGPSIRLAGHKGDAGQYFIVSLSAPPVGGVVTSSVGGLSCGASAVGVDSGVSPPQYAYAWYGLAAGQASKCGDANVPWELPVVLTAVPQGGNAFLSWAGDCAGASPTCVLTSGTDKQVIAIFGAPGSAHTAFTNPALHGPAYAAFAAGAAGALQCSACHGPSLAGQGVAPACSACHGWPLAPGSTPTPNPTPTPTGPKEATTLVLAAGPTPSMPAGWMTLTATVTPAAASGTVTFYDGGSPVGFGALSGGVAATTTSTLSVGTHTLTASYAGSSAHAPSTSPAVSLVVDVATPPGSAFSLPASRLSTWRPGVTYNGGISASRTVYTTLGPSGGDDTAAIQSALDACPANQVVKLAAGTFRISGSGVFPKSNTTLRGSGPGVTTLLAFGNNPIVVVGQLYFRYGSQVNLLTDAAKGAYTVTTATQPGWSSGEVVVVDEQFDPALTWYNTNQGQTDDYLGWGECRCAATASCASSAGSGCSQQATTAAAQAQSRPIGQAMEVASVTGSGPYTVTFTTPFHTSYRVSKVARIARLSGGVVPQRTGVGIEELTVSDGAGGEDGGGGIAFLGSARSWAKHVETTRSGNAAVLFKASVLCELRDSFVHSTNNPNPGGGGYGIAVDSYSADNLIENNISWNFNKVIVMRSSGGGNVVGYNYMDDGYGAGYPNQVENGLNGSHMATPHDELFEGNWGFNFSGDSTWGNSIAMTVFRNHLTGLRGARAYDGVNLSTFSKDGYYFEDGFNRRAAGCGDYHWGYSFIGNVLGFSGMPLLSSPRSVYKTPQTGFVYEWSQSTTDASVPMWKLGPMEQGTAADRVAMIATTLRYGNFDHATRTQRWHPFPDDGSASTATPPADSTLPPSLYQTVKPAFFGANPWPWVDPTSGATAVLPAKARFDAGTPNAVP